MKTSETHAVWIVEDSKAYADIITYLINNTSGLSCSKHFYSIEELESFIKTPYYMEAPDVILLDIDLADGQSGIEGLPWIKKAMPGIPVLMLTLHEDRDNIVAALEAGAEGYIPKDLPHDQITKTIKEGIAGRFFLSKRVKEHLLSHMNRPATPVDNPLTDKQMEVLRCMCDGLGRTQVAKKLGIKRATADNHYRHIYERLGVHSEAAAIVKAIKIGLIQL